MGKIAAFWFGPFLVLLLHIFTLISSQWLKNDIILKMNSESFPFPKVNIHIQLEPDDSRLLIRMNAKIERMEVEISEMAEEEEVLKRLELGVDKIMQEGGLSPEYINTLNGLFDVIDEINQEIKARPKKDAVLKEFHKGLDEIMDKLLADFSLEVPEIEDPSVLRTLLKQIKPNKKGELNLNEDFPKIHHATDMILDEIERLGIGQIMTKNGHMENDVFEAEFTIEMKITEKGKKYMRTFAKGVDKLVNEIAEENDFNFWSDHNLMENPLTDVF